MKASFLNGIKHFFKRSSILTKNIVIYTAIILLLCLILGLYIFNQAANQIKQNALDSEQYKIDQLSISLSEQFDSMISTTARIANDTFSSTETNESLLFRPYRWQHDKYNQIQVIWELEKFKDNNPLVKECILLYRQYDTIFATTTYGQTGMFFKDKLMIEPRETVVDLFYTTNTCTLLPVIIYDATTQTQYEALLYIIPFSLEKIATRDMAIAFVITADQLDSWSRLILGTQQYRISLLDDHQSIFSYGTFNGEPVSFTDFFTDNAILQDKMQSGDQTISLFLSYAKVPELTLLLESPWNKTLQQLYEFRNLTFAIVSVTVLIGIIMVILFSYFNYIPLRKILHSLRDQFPIALPPASRNEYQQLDSAIKATLVRNRNLEEYINTQNKSIYIEILRELLTGTIQYNRLDKTFDITSNLPGPYYCVMTIRIPVNEPEYPTAEEFNRHFSSIPDMSIRCSAVDMRSYHCTAIIGSIDGKHMDKWQDIIDSLLSGIIHYNDLYIGVSGLHHSIGVLNQCMIEAFLSLDFIESQKKAGMHFFSDSLVKNFRLDLTPESRFFELTQCIKNGNENQCIELFNTIMDAIQTYQNPIAAQLQYYHIANHMLKIINELPIEKTTLEFDFLSMFQNIDVFRMNMNLILKEACSYGSWTKPLSRWFRLNLKSTVF